MGGSIPTLPALDELTLVLVLARLVEHSSGSRDNISPDRGELSNHAALEKSGAA